MQKSGEIPFSPDGMWVVGMIIFGLLLVLASMLVIKQYIMGTKKIIGQYAYSKDRPKWAVTVGGIMQGISYFWGLCAVYCLLAQIGARDDERVPFLVAFVIFVVLVVANQIIGRRLAIGKKK